MEIFVGLNALDTKKDEASPTWDPQSARRGSIQAKHTHTVRVNMCGSEVLHTHVYGFEPRIPPPPGSPTFSSGCPPELVDLFFVPRPEPSAVAVRTDASDGRHQHLETVLVVPFARGSKEFFLCRYAVGGAYQLSDDDRTAHTVALYRTVINALTNGDCTHVFRVGARGKRHRRPSPTRCDKTFRRSPVGANHYATA